MNTKRSVVVSCLDKDVMTCFDKCVVACFDEGVLAILNNNNKDDFDVDIKHSLDVCLCFLSLHTPCHSFLREPWV